MRYDVEVSGLPQLARRPPLPAAAEGGRLSGHEARSRSGRAGTCRFSMGQGAGRRRRLLAQRLGPAGRRPTSCRTTTCRRSTASAPTSTSSTWRTTSCDFISAVDTPIVWELNIWYHTLNCGYRCADQRRDRFSLHLRRLNATGKHYLAYRTCPCILRLDSKKVDPLCRRFPKRFVLTAIRRCRRSCAFAGIAGFD